MDLIREAYKIIEEARQEITKSGLMFEIFGGNLNPSLDFFQPQSPEDKKIGDEYLKKLSEFLKKEVDTEEIERTAKIPERILEGLAKLGAFGMVIPKEYGGLGFSQTNYNRALAYIASYSDIVALTLSVHQSIGVPRPLLLFGTDEQKNKWLPRLAKGEISAFAFTEPGVGSDPAGMKITATLTPDGNYYLINGEKLWITNAALAKIILLIAKVDGKITAFIMETEGQPIEKTPCEFMGCRGMDNAYLKFNNAKVPKGNVLAKTGKGLHLALTTLNYGRVSIAAICLGMAESLYKPAFWWVNKRETFGQKLGSYEGISNELDSLSCNIFAMEAAVRFVSGLIDQNKNDFRIEAAAVKLFCATALWEIANKSLEIFGGRGYEKAESKKRHGEAPIPVERILRAAKMYLIGEGSTKILELFIVREGIDGHKKKAERYYKIKKEIQENIGDSLKKLFELWRLTRFYAKWVLKQLIYKKDVATGSLRVYHADKIKYVIKTHKRFARTIFGLMVKYRKNPKDFEREQITMFNLAGIAVDIFMLLVVLPYSCHVKKTESCHRAPEFAEKFFLAAQERIESRFLALKKRSGVSARNMTRDPLASYEAWIVRETIQHDWLL